MTNTDIGFLTLGILSLLLTVPVIWWYRRRSQDEIFTGITPGELPGVGHHVGRATVGGNGEWAGTLAVRFTPPDGVIPGLIGTVIDGRADVHDLSATLVDLAVKGHFRISPRPDATRIDGQAGRADFHLTLADHTPAGPALTQPETILLNALAQQGPTVRLSDLGADFAQSMREAQVALYREVVDRHWYTEHPRIQGRRLGCLLTTVALLVGLGLLAVVAMMLRAGDVGPISLVFPLCVLVAAYLLFRGARKRSARTAEGTAIRIQALGFREYLTKAEASQIRFEEARDLFSRYLPYAIVFEVADRWAHLFGEVAARAHAAGWGDAYFDLSWFDAMDTAALIDSGLDVLDVLDGAHGLADLADVADVTAGLGDALGGLATGVGDFASSVTDLLSVGDGCDLGGCDGCDFS